MVLRRVGMRGNGPSYTQETEFTLWAKGVADTVAAPQPLSLRATIWVPSTKRYQSIKFVTSTSEVFPAQLRAMRHQSWLSRPNCCQKYYKSDCDDAHKCKLFCTAPNLWRKISERHLNQKDRFWTVWTVYLWNCVLRELSVYFKFETFRPSYFFWQLTENLEQNNRRRMADVRMIDLAVTPRIRTLGSGRIVRQISIWWRQAERFDCDTVQICSRRLMGPEIGCACEKHARIRIAQPPVIVVWDSFISSICKRCLCTKIKTLKSTQHAFDAWMMIEAQSDIWNQHISRDECSSTSSLRTMSFKCFPRHYSSLLCLKQEWPGVAFKQESVLLIVVK